MKVTSGTLKFDTYGICQLGAKETEVKWKRLEFLRGMFLPVNFEVFLF